jgi:nucleoside 2-deoxyribosyltransferase
MALKPSLRRPRTLLIGSSEANLKKIYLIGSLRNPAIPMIAACLRELGFEVFDDWFAAGPEADDYWQKYEQERGHTYAQALAGFAANHVYHFDKHHLDTCDIAILALPAGKSGHLELGYAIGSGKAGYILLDESKPVERWDVMYLFAKEVHHTLDTLLAALERDHK